MSDRVVHCPFPDDTPVPEHSFAETIWKTMKKFREKLAVVEVETGSSITYTELMKKSESVARQLLSKGCQRHDVIGIFAPNCIDWVVVCLAAMRIGATAAGIMPILTPSELSQQLQTCAAKYVFTIQPLAGAAVEVAKPLKIQVLVMGDGCPGCVDISPRQTSPGQSSPGLPTFASLRLKVDDDSVIWFSSGTTGPAKAIKRSDRFLQNQVLVTTHPKSAIISDVQLIFPPMSHGIGFSLAFYGLAFGATNHMMAMFDIDRFFAVLQEKEIESVVVIPLVIMMILKSTEPQKYPFGQLKDLVIIGSPLKPSTEDLLLKTYPGLQLRQCWGLSEAGLVAAIPFELGVGVGEKKAGSVGVPLHNTHLKVVDMQTSELLGAGSEGEICVKSPAVMHGYMTNTKGSGVAFLATVDWDGWLHTGDFGYYDEDGYFFVVDRTKDLIKYNNQPVPPTELETLLMSHPDVDDVAVIALPDPSAGELPLAWVVKKESSSITEQQLRQFVDENVAAYKRLRGGIRFVPSLPRSWSGKILYREIRKWLHT